VSGLTPTGHFLGSLHYVAPEQIKGEKVDARTDVYAGGCVAFEMLAGRPAFDMDGEAALLWAHMSASPPSLRAVRPDLPPAVDDVLARAMAKDPADRPATCGEFVAEMRSAFAAMPGVAPIDRAAPTQVTGSQQTPTAPHTAGAHPSFPPGTPAGVAPGTARGPEPTTLRSPAGWVRIPAPGGRGGPAVTGPPPRSGGSGATSTAAAGRGRGRWWLLAALALVVVLAAALVVWRPWSGPDLVTRDLVVVPFSADAPDDWETFAATGDLVYSVLGSRDWTGLAIDDTAAVADAEAALTDDPESLVHLYVDASENVDADDPQGLADQVQATFDGARIVGQGTRQVDGRDALTAGGVMPFGDGQLRVYAVTLQDDPRLFLLFLSPASLYDEWKPTFDEIVDSVRFTG
jgi:hypothetical protein